MVKPTLKNITFVVISIHLLMVVTLLFSSPKKNLRPSRHIAVRTVRPSSSAEPKTRSVAVVASPKKASPVPKPKPVSKESPKIKPATSQRTPAKPPAPKKTTVVEKNKPPKAAPPPQVWKEIDEALAKIDDKVYSKPQAKLDVPQMKSSAAVVVPFPDFREESSEETLVSFLHNALNLPEFGEVKIQLTVKKDGSVSHLVVLQAESQQNKAYLQQHLPHLKFPLILDNEKTFTLTFCNEI